MKMIHRMLIPCVVGLSLWFGAGPARAAVDMFLKIDGIEGESTDKDHSKEIDVLAWAWGASNSGTTHVGGGGGAGKVSVQDLSITKYVDKASPKLFRSNCDGKWLDRAVLTVRKAGGDQKEFYEFALSNLVVTSISLSTRGGERVTENFSLDFSQLQVTYKQILPTGSVGSTRRINWDVVENTGLVTDPTAASFKATLLFNQGAPTATLSWPSVAGVSYVVQFTDSLASPFQTLATYPSAGDGVTTVEVPANQVRGFFRVQLSP